MTDTQTHANGIENGLEEDLARLRPADIDADVKEMERRKRVEMIMNSKLFREELERIIEMQMKDGNGPAGLLQQISDMMGIQAGKLHTTQMFRGSNCVTPINDIRGVESMGYAKGEKHLRCKLASVFRLMDLYGWSQGIHNQITVRLNQDEEHFLVNPYGMLYNEITASSLVKVDMQGNVVEPGTTNFSVNTQVFLLHSSIHASRPDVKCIIHIHTPSVLAVSSLKCGLLPLCQEALVIGEVSQHPFVSGIFEPEEREKIIRNLGPTNKILLLNNHGALCCGETVEEAFYNVYNTVLACETQIKLMPIGIDNLVLVNDETRKQVYDAAHRAPEADGDKKVKHFRVGELEFEALIRMLDNAGFRTGYIYRHPLVKGEVPKPKNDVEVPPAVSSLGYLIEEEKLYKQGNWKKYVDGRNRLDRTKWLNSPNVYQKVEILETGTPDPKKITKWVDQNSEEWVAENSPTHSSTPVKIDSALQFVPKNTNPKEFKNLQQQIKKNRLADKITSGPQSHILEGVTWEEAKKLQDANITQTGDQVILVGAASKGIIQRNFQHNALVYKTPYAKNPFDSISDKEIEDYKRLIERKQRGDTDYEESQSESEAVSSRQEALRHIKSPLMSPQSATSETEEESRDEPRVLRIETKTAPQPIQAEVVLSDAEFDTTDARVERSQSARYPKAEKPESVTIVNSFRKSWSLKRDKDRNKDVEIPDLCFSRVMESSLILTNLNTEPVEPFHSCIARITNLKQKPVLVDTRMHADEEPSEPECDPCSPRLCDGECGGEKGSLPDDCQTDSDSNFDLKRRLRLRKKLIYSAKLRFLGLDGRDADKTEVKGDDSPRSRVCFLISEIRDKINEIMSPGGGGGQKEGLDVQSCSSLKWIPRRKFVERNAFSGKCEGVHADKTLEIGDDEQRLSLGERQNAEDVKVREVSDHALVEHNPCNDSCEPDSTTGDISDVLREGKNGVSDESQPDAVISRELFDIDENTNEKIDIRIDAQVIKSLLTELVRQVDVPEEEVTSVPGEESDAHSCSCAESTETDWYYSKTILKLDNSQTVLEMKEVENEGVNPGKQSDTGIETDFTSEKDDRRSEEGSSLEAKALDMRHDGNAADEGDVLESSAFNKSSETDSSLLKSSSGRTSVDIDTSSAFKTEAENSEQQAVNSGSSNETKDAPIVGCGESGEDSPEKRTLHHIHEQPSKLPGIPESPEFTNVDTEDAPITSSSKGSSPEVGNDITEKSRDEPVNVDCEQEVNNNETSPSKKKRKKRGKKRCSTKITVKKEVAEKDAKEPVVSEIKLTIKNSSNFTSESYEFEIQDETNTSEEMSRTTSSLGESFEDFQPCEVIEGNCDCEAQQSLETLQSEVTSTIERLHNIENYFEDEIKSLGGNKDEELAVAEETEELVIAFDYNESGVEVDDGSGFFETSLEDVSGSLPEGGRAELHYRNIPEEVLSSHSTESIQIDNPEITLVQVAEAEAEVKGALVDVSEVLSEEAKPVEEREMIEGRQTELNSTEDELCEAEVPEVSCNVEITSEPELDLMALVDDAANEPGPKGDVTGPTCDLKIDDLIDFNGLLLQIISNSEATKFKAANTINDVVEFILNDEESPTDSLTEFEDIENVVSMSESIATEPIESTGDNPDADSTLEDDDELLSAPYCKRKKRKVSGGSTFNILIATPTRKEIFINYDEKASSSFSILPDTDAKCNSYINTDDVNEDFEDSPEWFSVGSPGKVSCNTSFESALSNAEGGSSPVCSCVDFNEVPSGENTFNGDHSDAHQSTFSHSSKEGSPTKDRSTEESPKKEKKKKKGLRTPSFLKKKKEKKKVEA